MLVRQRNVDFCAGSPKNNDAVAVVSSLKVTDILTELFYHVPTGSSILDISTIQTFSKIVIESCRHWLDGFQFIFYSVQVFFFQDFCIHSSLVCVIRENIPTSENNVIQICQRYNIFDKFFLIVFHTHSSQL